MNPQFDQYANVSRRAPDIEDYVDILRRHKAWIIGPAFAALVISVVGAFMWPDTYVSTAVIRVVPSQVPEKFVPTNINMEMSQRINAMYQVISSRDSLTTIINNFNLYPRERKRKPTDDIVEDMRKDIKIGNVTSVGAADKNISGFQISFSYDNRFLAQNVTKDLVSRFLTENTRNVTQQSMYTTDFLSDQLQTAAKELEEIESRVAKFSQSFAGKLPEQVQNNLMQINAAESRIANINMALSRTDQERLVLNSDLRSEKNRLAALTPPDDVVAVQEKNQKLEQVDREIAALERGLSTLREHYKDTWPDVKRVQSQLNAALKTKELLIAEEKNEKPAAGAPKRFNANYERERQSIEGNISRTEALLKAKDLQVEELRKGHSEAERAVRLLQARVQETPVGQQQYSTLIRDRETAKVRYEELKGKRDSSKMSSDLRGLQGADQLDLLDQPSLPQTPTKPKRPMVVGMGAALGLMLGIALAGVREAKDTSLKNLKDVRAYTQLNILGSIPMLENDLVVRRRRRLAWLAWSTACLAGILIMAGAVFYYYTTKS